VPVEKLARVIAVESNPTDHRILTKERSEIVCTFILDCRIKRCPVTHRAFQDVPKSNLTSLDHRNPLGVFRWQVLAAHRSDNRPEMIPAVTIVLLKPERLFTRQSAEE
jgi:hypothetical protein